jgi:hypothetical protein
MRPDLGPHFLIAAAAEAAAGADSVELDGVDGFAVSRDGEYGIFPEDLAQLHCLLLGRETDFKVLDMYEIAFARDQTHGPWLVRLPDEFVKALSALDMQDVPRLADQWLKATDGTISFHQAPKSVGEVVVGKLAQLARRAIQEDRRMYWEAPSC